MKTVESIMNNGHLSKGGGGNLPDSRGEGEGVRDGEGGRNDPTQSGNDALLYCHRCQYQSPASPADARTGCGGLFTIVSQSMVRRARMTRYCCWPTEWLDHPALGRMDRDGETFSKQPSRKSARAWPGAL